jgi:hypothetical protein
VTTIDGLAIDFSGPVQPDAQVDAVVALREALAVERRRVPTRPTAASRTRRLEDKRRRSQTKRLRRDLGD